MYQHVASNANHCSLSEYGCIKNTRTFNQVAAIYSDQMDAVYSGGLVYEYSEEADNAGYGLVKIDGSSVTEKDDYSALKSAFSKTKNPTGDGGFKTGGSPAACPSKSANWNVTISGDQLPALPSGVDAFFKNGAGTALGLKGGSQDSGSDKVNLAPAASGAVTTGASATQPSGSAAGASKGAAPGLVPGSGVAPLACGIVVVVSAMLGGSLIL